MALPVIDRAQMRAWEAATWATGLSEWEVIRRAGQAVAREAERLSPEGGRVLVLAGKGHNGDDARQAALALRGRQVECIDLTDPAGQVSELQRRLEQPPALIIDGLFGIGLNRPLAPEWVRTFRAIRESGSPVLAVDVPSGLQADSGEALPEAVRAHTTLTLGTIKRGLLQAAAWPFVGRLEVASGIGLVPCPFSSEAQWLQPADFAGFPPPREAAGHKGTYGHVLIVAGSVGYHGAAVLAARGALRAQPGLVTVWTLPETYLPVASQLQAAMVHPWRPSLSAPPSVSALVVGPGLAASDCPPALREEVGRWWTTTPMPMLADASALAWLPACPGASLPGPRILTPHPGEAARLLDRPTAAVQMDRPRALRELSNRYGDAWVVLKGHQSLLGRSQGEFFINPTGNPHLAQGGSGDLLAGFLGGWLAQTESNAAALAKALAFGVWRHGQAADELQYAHRRWTIDDLATRL